MIIFNLFSRRRLLIFLLWGIPSAGYLNWTSKILWLLRKRLERNKTSRSMVRDEIGDSARITLASGEARASALGTLEHSLEIALDRRHDQVEESIDQIISTVTIICGIVVAITALVAAMLCRRFLPIK